MTYMPGGNRATDKNKLAWVVDMLGKANWLFTLVIVVMLALGFGFKTPKAKFEEIDNVVKSLNNKISVVEGGATELRKLVEDMVTMECIKGLRGTAEARRTLLDAQVPCARLLRERGLQ